MRVLLSTIGSRGDVRPLVALASQLRALGQEVRLCVPPDFCDWIEGLGMPVVPIGPELRQAGRADPAAALPTPEQRRQLMEGTLATQFETIAAAAQRCDLIVGATALQIAAPWVAERMGLPYVFAAYCPTVLPSPQHAPPVLAMLGDAPAPAAADYRKLWEKDARRWNEDWGPLFNAQRAALGLAPVADVRSHILTERPWLAADPTLAPWPDPADDAVFQTGAWILSDARPLSRAGGVPCRWRATRLLRLRQHPRTSRPHLGDDRLGPCARAAGDRVAWLGRAVARRRRSRLPGHR